MQKTTNISALSPHLFWDVDPGKITWEKDSHFLVQRILEYGKESDWQLLIRKYTVKEIAEIATQFRTLDEVALSFISTISKIPIHHFRCYTPKQSAQRYTGF